VDTHRKVQSLSNLLIIEPHFTEQIVWRRSVCAAFFIYGAEKMEGTIRTWLRDEQFGWLISDIEAVSTWFCAADFVGDAQEIKQGLRVSYTLFQYVKKGMTRTKGTRVTPLPQLTVAEPEVIGPDSVTTIRAAKPRPPAPSAEVIQKLVNEQPAVRKFVRI
jgi:hypothetical protein